jgi:hypothetical protein
MYNVASFSVSPSIRKMCEVLLGRDKLLDIPQLYAVNRILTTI